MTHTAKEIRKKFDILIDHEVSSYLANKIEKAINEARIEAIKESADLCDETEDNRFEHKQYILKLIDQIK